MTRLLGGEACVVASARCLCTLWRLRRSLRPCAPSRAPKPAQCRNVPWFTQVQPWIRKTERERRIRQANGVRIKGVCRG